MTLIEYINIGSLIGVCGFLWKLSKDVNAINADFNNKIDKVYHRMDAKTEALKKEIKEDCVNKDVCKILHDNSEKNYFRLETAIKELTGKIDKYFGLNIK